MLVAGPAMQASAINREWSAVLGFLGGCMVANGGLCPRTVCQEPVYVERPVYRETIIVEEPVVTGHYEYRERRIWEPGFWEHIVTRCGRESACGMTAVTGPRWSRSGSTIAVRGTERRGHAQAVR